MKIIQLIQKPQRRGAEIFAAQLSQQLSELDHEVLLVSIFKGKADLPFSGTKIELNRPLSNRLFDLKGWKFLAKTIKEFKPDIIQANAADTLKFSVFSKLVFGWRTPIIYRNANQMGDFIKGRIHRKFNQFLINQILGVISVSEASQKDFHQNFKFPEAKSIRIPIGIDSKEIDEKLKEKPTQTLPKSFLIQIGGWVPEKDPLGMLDIFSRLSNPDINLILLGSGPLENSLRDKIGQLELKNRVKLIPSHPNIFPLLRKASALAMPSHIEGLPAVILEAMNLKIPVTAYGVGGIPEVLKNGESGWCVPPNDQNGFLAALEEVLALDAESKETILSNAFQLVTSEYSLDKIALQFEDFYSRLIGK